jgi:Tfp pilus assembly major pilin PilA
MFKQIGITSIELLLSLTIASSLTAFTLSMSEEVEEAVVDYQQQTIDVKALRERIQTAPQQKTISG